MVQFGHVLGASQAERSAISAPHAWLSLIDGGDYVVLSFKMVFEHKKSAIETVTFMLDHDGKWRAAGYFIKQRAKEPVAAAHPSFPNVQQNPRLIPIPLRRISTLFRFFEGLHQVFGAPFPDIS